MENSSDSEREEESTERRRSSRTRKEVQRFHPSDDSESDELPSRSKKKSKQISSDSEIEFDDSPVTSREKKRSPPKNKFEQFGFKVTDKKTAVASMSSLSDRAVSSSRTSRSKRAGSKASEKQSGRQSRRALREKASVNYADPQSDDSSGSEDSEEASMNEENSAGSDNSESDQFEETARPMAKSNRGKSTKASATSGGRKRGTRGGTTDSLASLSSRKTSRRGRSSVAEENGEPTRQISYAEQGSDDEMFFLTSDEDENDRAGGNRKKNSKSSGSKKNSSSKPSQSSKSREGERSGHDDEESPASSGDSSTDDSDSNGSEDTGSSFAYRIQMILGTETRTAAEWVPICEAMDTREVTRGSVWQQSDKEFFSSSDSPVTKYLIKWAHASYLHVSWEAEHDLVAMVGTAAKTQIKRFRETSVNGRVTVFDDLGVGEYFPPNYLEIDRILDVDDEQVEMTTVDWENALLPPAAALEQDMEEEGSDEAAEDGADDGVESPGNVSEKSEADVEAERDDMEEEEDAKKEDAITAQDAEESPSTSSPPRRRSSRTASAVARMMMADLVEKPSPIRERPSRKQTRKEAAQSRQRQRDQQNGSTPKQTKKSTKKSSATAYPYLHSGKCFVTVKWDNLPYSETTFEDINDLIKYQVDFEKPLRMFYKREQTTPAKNSRRVFKRKLDASLLQSENGPDFNGGELRDYQWTGVRWLLFSWSQRRNTILADEMGLGKTIQTAAFLHILKNFQGMRGPFLVVAPLSTIVQWQREISAWTNMDVIIYHGSQDDRELSREYEFFYNSKKKTDGYKIEVVITTPETCTSFDQPKASRLSRELSKIHWDMLIVDEAHKLKNFSSKLSTTLRDEYTYSNCVLLTGTPLQNSTEELWTLLNFVDNDAFHSSEDFAAEFGDLKDSVQLEKLQKKLGPYLLRREKENVEKSVPPKEEIIVEVELTVLQKQYYRAIFEQNKNFLFRGAVKDGPSLTNLAMELRKCCNHPYLIKGAESELIKHYTNEDASKTHVDMMVQSSGKLVLLDKLLPKLREDGHRVLIFSQFRIMLDILEDYLNMRYFSHERVDGAVTGKKRQAAIDKFSAPGSNIFVMLLSTRAGGVGINLTAADTVIIFDSDWNPQNDIQAQARAHRIGQTQPVKVYRLLTCKTYEMEMFRSASLKLGLDYAIMHNMKGGEKKSSGSSLSTKELESLLKHGAYDIFREEKEGTAEKNSRQFCEAGIDSILERSMVVVHGGNGAQKPSANFSKASFVATGGNNLDVNDPDFWTKIVGLEVADDVDDMPRKRKCTTTVGSYTEPPKVDQLFLLDSDSDFSDDGQPSGAKRSKSSGGGANGRKKKDSGKEQAIVPADWTPENLNVLLSALVIHGYGNWEAIRMGARLHYSLSDIAKGCRNLVLFLNRVNCFASIGSEVTHFKGEESYSHRVSPGDPVHLFDSAQSFMNQLNSRVLVRLAVIALQVEKEMESSSDFTDTDTLSNTVLNFLPPIDDSSKIEVALIQALFLTPAKVPTGFQYLPGALSTWRGKEVATAVQMARELPLPIEFTKYEEYLISNKLRTGIVSKLNILEDMFTVLHALEVDRMRGQVAKEQLSIALPPSSSTPVVTSTDSVDDAILATPTEEASSNTAFSDTNTRETLLYPFPVASQSLQEFLEQKLLIEDSPSDWWVTGSDDVLLLQGIVKFGMPDKVSRLNDIERLMGRADPGPKHRPRPPSNPTIDNDTFLIGGQGYLKDDEARSVSDSEFFLEKTDIMKRVKDIFAVFCRVSSVSSRTSFFHSEVLRAIAKYGMPTELLESTKKSYESGTRKFTIFEKPASTTDSEGVSAEVTTVDQPTDIDPSASSVVSSEDGNRLQFLPTWKDLALATENNIVRLNALKSTAINFYNGSTENTSLSRAAITTAKGKAQNINIIRLFLFCYNREDAMAILEKGKNVPSSDASRTLWWTTEHDYRLMQLVCKYGWGSWKQICDDESELNVTNVPKGFVVPAREPTDTSVCDRIIADVPMITCRLNFLSSFLNILKHQANPPPPKAIKPQQPKPTIMSRVAAMPQRAPSPKTIPVNVTPTSSASGELSVPIKAAGDKVTTASTSTSASAFSVLMSKQSASGPAAPTDLKSRESKTIESSTTAPRPVEAAVVKKEPVVESVSTNTISPVVSGGVQQEISASSSISTSSPPASCLSSNQSDPMPTTQRPTSTSVQASKYFTKLATPSPLTVATSSSPSDSSVVDLTTEAKRTAPLCEVENDSNTSASGASQKRALDVVVLDIDDEKNRSVEPSDESSTVVPDAKRAKVSPSSTEAQPKKNTIMSFFKKKSIQ